jgi:rubrerythrin
VNTDTIKVLEACHELEKTMAKIYFGYVEVFKEYKPLAAVWHKTALEEENHALQFDLALKIKVGLVESTKVDLFKVMNSLNTVKSVLENILKSPPTPLDALRSAINLERQLAEFHLDCLASFENISHKEMFRAMMQADKDHIKVLEKTYQALLDAGQKGRRPVAV